ncbi:hypothetical protein D021_3153B, partial [Vibrio parahaemolyticus 10296]
GAALRKGKIQSICRINIWLFIFVVIAD